MKEIIFIICIGEGAAIIEGLLKEVLERAVVQGVVQGIMPADYVVTVPLVENIPDVKFTTILQGTVHTVEIEGVVSV